MKMVNENSDSYYAGSDFGSLQWTPEAIARLGLIVTATIRHRQMSERGFASFINKNSGSKISANTINRFANGTMKYPTEKTLRTIAPYIHCVTKIDGKIVEIDSVETYTGNSWIDLARLAAGVIEAKPIAPKNVDANKRALADFILDYQDEHGITQRKFEELVNKETQLSIEKLREILSGVEPSDSELWWIACVIKDENSQFYSWDFWQALKQGVPAAIAKSDEKDQLFEGAGNGNNSHS